MLICGLKFTHDGGMALIKNNKLLFSIEMEKRDNNSRFSGITDTKSIVKILNEQGYDIDKIDKFIIDGFGNSSQKNIDKNIISHNNNFCDILKFKDFGSKNKIKLAGYNEIKEGENVLAEKKYTGLMINNKNYNYSSFYHVTGHIMGAYASSPFSKNKENSYVLIWDGGTYPRLYFFDAKKNKVFNLGALFPLYGKIYYLFPNNFTKFRINPNIPKDHLSIPGKVMAYIALGEKKSDIFEIFEDIYNNYSYTMGYIDFFWNKFKKRIVNKNYTTEDILCTFHYFIEKLLLENLEKKVLKFNFNNRNLCFAGGSALNIKWNSAIRKMGLFDKIYVPPFTNDSGSAIGMACCGMKELYLDWSVFSGPDIIKNKPLSGWIKKQCSISSLAALLYKKNEPIVVLNEKSELGPRALGNRSILASPLNYSMKETLNKIKKREDYRPISPICKEDKAKEIFDPGSKDPYMLFDHKVRKEWLDKIPAVVHLDGTARLQTVSQNDNPNIYRLLDEYEKLSGIPVLCNTSANFLGKGFFPDIRSAARWGGTNYVWCDGDLYQKIKDK